MKTELKKTFICFGPPATYAVAGLLFLSLYPFYPGTFFYAFGLLLILFATISYFRPVLAASLFIACGSFFGNHPGGRFLEIFDLSLVICIAGLLRPTRAARAAILDRQLAGSNAGTSKSGQKPSNLYRVLIGLLTVSILSYAGAFYLLEAFEGYKVWPFHFMNAPEWLPHYSIRVAIAGTLCALFAILFLQRAKLEDARFAGLMLMAALLLPICIGILDAWLPPVARILDRYHIYLDGYVDRSPSHLFASLRLPGVSDAAPNSLFWNRSWLMVYCTGGIPLFGLGMALQNRTQFDTWLTIAMGFLFLLIVLLAGARAPLLGFLIFLLGLGSLILFRTRNSWIPAGIAIATALGVLAVPAISFTVWAIPALGDRSMLYRNGVTIWQAFPLFGGGVESFGFWNDALLRPANFAPTLESSHNLALQILSGTGLLGLLFFGALLFRSVRVALRESRNATRFLPAAITFAGLLAVLVHSSFQEWWYIRPVQLQFWLGLLGPLAFWEAQSANVSLFQRVKDNKRWANSRNLTFSFFALLSLLSVSFWRGYRLGDRFELQENVGHREKKDGQWVIPLLEGDGQYYIRENGVIQKHRFQCEQSVATGNIDARKICAYAPLPKP